MLRGFRWQLVALVIAASLFVVILLTRTSVEPGDLPSIPTQQPTPISTEPAAAVTPLPTSIAVLAPQTQGEIVTYREALVGEVQRLNPLLAGLNPVDADITSLIFEGLTRTNQYGEPVPALAKEWVISADGLEYVVTLRDDVLWQDGLPFTAADVAYTMTVLGSPEFPGPAELGAFWRTVETEQLGDHLVRFRLAQPLGSFLTALRVGILPAHALLGTTAGQLASHPFNLTPIGTGPYQLEALRSSRGGRIDGVYLRVAPVYRQRPEGQSGFALERVRFRLYDTFDQALQGLRSGEVDALAAGHRGERPPLLQNGSLNVYTTTEPVLGAVIFNWARPSTPFFREQRVRVALEVGLDRTSIIERHLSNLTMRADGPLAPGSWAYSAGVWPSHNVEAARILLESLNLDATPTSDEAAATQVGSGLFSFTLLVPDDAALVNVAQEIAAQWSQLGLVVTVDSVAPEMYRERLAAHDFDAALVELALGPDPDGYAYWHQGQYPDGKNYGGVDDRRISEALERARQDAGGLNRAIYYRRFQQDFVERAIAIPLYYPLFTYATVTGISGVQLGFMDARADRFRTIQDWTINAG